DFNVTGPLVLSFHFLKLFLDSSLPDLPNSPPTGQSHNEIYCLAAVRTRGTTAAAMGANSGLDRNAANVGSFSTIGSWKPFPTAPRRVASARSTLPAYR